MSSLHEVKAWPEPFEALADGRKPFEVRQDDRDFVEGDLLLVREFVPERRRYTGRTQLRRITYVLPGGSFGLPAGLSVLGVLLPGEGAAGAIGPAEQQAVDDAIQRGPAPELPTAVRAAERAVLAAGRARWLPWNRQERAPMSRPGAIVAGVFLAGFAVYGLAVGSRPDPASARPVAVQGSGPGAPSPAAAAPPAPSGLPEWTAADTMPAQRAALSRAIAEIREIAPRLQEIDQRTLQAEVEMLLVERLAARTDDPERRARLEARRAQLGRTLRLLAEQRQRELEIARGEA